MLDSPEHLLGYLSLLTVAKIKTMQIEPSLYDVFRKFFL